MRIKSKDTKCVKQYEFFFYCVNICKHKHEKNMTRLQWKIVLENNVKQTKKNEGSYFYLYPFGNLAQGSFQGSFLCIE
jgi:hypothetical protein